MRPERTDAGTDRASNRVPDYPQGSAWLSLGGNQVDINSKQKNVSEGMVGEAGDVWTWTAIDADTKLVQCWHVGGRSMRDAQEFIDDLAGRLSSRVQLTTDGQKPYLEAVENAFGNDIDYARLIRIYGTEGKGSPEKRYSSSKFVQAQCGVVTGNPDKKHVSTSYVERQNLTMRLSMQRFTSLTNGFSKKVQNHMHAISLHFMHYNFCLIHKSLKVTPAMRAGIADTAYDLEFIVKMIDERGPYKKGAAANSN